VGGDDGAGVFVMQDMNASGEQEPIYGLTPCTVTNFSFTYWSAGQRQFYRLVVP